MFSKRVKELQELVDSRDREVASRDKEIATVKFDNLNAVKMLENKHKMAIRELEQLCQMKCEKMDIELKKKELEMRHSYSRLQVDNANVAVKRIESILDQVIDLIPNISASLEVKKGGKK